MPDFELKISSNVTVVDWIDNGNASTPSRLNPKVGRNEKRLSVNVGQTVTLTATVGEVEGPLDSALDGRLFHGDHVEAPHVWTLGWSNPDGQSSAQSFVPTIPGSYTVQLRREGGGAIIVHIDAEAT